MEQDSKETRDGVISQIKEIRGKVIYSQTTHIKEARLLSVRNNGLKTLQIIISSISICGLFAVLFKWNDFICALATTFLTVVGLVISTFLRSSRYEDRIASHINTANSLWLLREKLTSLLTDEKILDLECLCKLRDKYILELSNVYRTEQLTSDKAYQKAKLALKNDEEQYLSDEELDNMSPKHLRHK